MELEKKTKRKKSLMEILNSNLNQGNHRMQIIFTKRQTENNFIVGNQDAICVEQKNSLDKSILSLPWTREIPGPRSLAQIIINILDRKIIPINP